MAIPTWTPGEVLTSSDVNSWFVPEVAYKTSTTARTSTTSLADDPDLTLAVAASASYAFQGFFIYDGGAGGSEGDFKFKFTVPTSASIYWGDTFRNTTPTIVCGGHVTTDTETASTNGLGTWYSVNVQGLLIVSSTAGNLTLQWAQGSSSATRTDLGAGSWLMAQRVA